MGSKARGGVKSLMAGQEVVCRVQQALEDLIMVSYTGPGNKLFQGVLLDSTKRNIPYGISPSMGFQTKLVSDFQSSKPDMAAASEEYPTLCRRQTYYQEGRPPKPPLSLPGGKAGKTFMGQDRLGVRLRARQVLCSKCSSVCNEKGENVKESARKEKESRGGDQREDPRGGSRTSQAKPVGGGAASASATSSSSTPSASSSVDRCRSGSGRLSSASGAGKSSTPKIVPSKTVTRVKKEMVQPPPPLPLKPSIENSPAPIVDIDKLQARATSNLLVPKLRRLRIPGILASELQGSESRRDSSEVLPSESVSEQEETIVSTPSSSQETGDPTITSSRVSSSTPSLPTDSMQPLKIRFAHKQSSRNSSRQYSIVKDEDSDSSDQQKENIDENESEDSEVEKRKDNGHLETEEGNSQPLKKVFKKEMGADVPTVCRVTQAAPVLKISFGNESTVLKLPALASTSKKEEDSLKPPSLPSPRPNHSASSKAARKALKRAKKEAQRRARLGLASPARTYLGSRSPGNLANVSPTSSPLHLTSPRPLSTPSPAYTLLCPTSQKIIIKKVKKKKHKRGRQVSGPEVLPSTSRIFLKDDDGKARRSLRECRPIGPLGGHPVDETLDFLVPRPNLPVESAVLPDGHTLCVGDVVWGRAEVNGWWPGKVVNLMMREEGRAMAQVTWYTGTTTSIIPCKELKPFLESYETQFNKRKSGAYPEAVHLASEDARQASSIPLAVSPHRPPLSCTVPSSTI